METLKEYAGVAAALGALGLWAINAQVMPEINRVEGRIDGNLLLLRQIDRKIDRHFEALGTKFKAIDDNFKTMDAKFKTMDDRFAAMDNRLTAIDVKFELIDDKFEGIDDRFERIDGELKTIRHDIKTILLRLPDKAAAR